MTVTEPRTGSGMTWQRLLHLTAAVNAAVLLAVGIALGDRETIAFGAIFGLALIFLRLRGGVAGIVTMLVLAIDAAAWMAPAAYSNIANREETMDVLIPASLAVISLTASIAAVFSILRRRRPEGEGKAVRIVAQTAIAVLVLAAGAGVLQKGESDAVQPGDIVVEMQGAAFSSKTLEAPAGPVTLAVSNGDLFWHTLTIDELGVDVGLATGGERRVTFQAAAGSYEYYCKVPGHVTIGMKGTLTVR